MLRLALSRRCARSRARAAQSCILFHNWWPLLTGVTYVVAPMPILFLASGDSQGGYSSMGGGADSWEDMAKFLVGARVLHAAP